MGVVLTVFALFIALMQGVFCKTWNAMVPKSIVGISGSCVTVPCGFEVPDEMEKGVLNCSDKGVWRRQTLSGPIVFTDTPIPSTKNIQGKIFGDLTKKNCTTSFHNFPENYSDVYFFRLECSEIFRYTFPNGVNINIRQDPSPPLLTSESQVSEGAQVRVQCSVPMPCSTLPPSLIWLPRDNSRQEEKEIQQNMDGQMILTSTLTFTASVEHHNQNITCSVSYPLTKGGSSKPSATSQRLAVLYAPRFTMATLSPSGPVSEGRIVTFSCSSDANPPVSMYTWYRTDSGKLTKKGEGDTLILKVNQEDSGVYLCEAQTERGSERSRPMPLEVNAATGISDSLQIPYIICVALLVLYVVTVAVTMYKYQNLSKRLKQIELKGEHTYTDLRMCNVSSDYDQLQDPSCRVLDVLKPLQTLARNPNEKCVTVVQSGGDKGMNQLFGI
ncbi:sialoadhesin [Morone saxatilis]|uniref:sialoadhesin n=1 Tax=Morone saxatilis TaxID=34816 RepID=UPI0015E24AE5|nr:sialoadhesin [Morone saxatilis]